MNTYVIIKLNVYNIVQVIRLHVLNNLFNTATASHHHFEMKINYN